MAVFRVEKTKNYAVMSKHHFQDKSISLKAKGLLSEMLSLPESWDYTLAGLASINKESVDAIRTAVWELEKAGYIVRRQGRDEKGKMSAIEYIIYEHPQLPTPMSENPILENPTSDNPTTANPSAAHPTAENPTQLNNKQSNTKELSIDSINHPSKGDRADEMKTRSELEEEIKANIDYDIIIANKQNDRRQIDEIVTLMLDAICSPSPTVRINGADIPKSAVRERFLQLDSEHIEYVSRHVREVTQSPEAWRNFLDTVSRFPEFSFYENLAIHSKMAGARLETVNPAAHDELYRRLSDKYAIPAFTLPRTLDGLAVELARNNLHAAYTEDSGIDETVFASLMRYSFCYVLARKCGVEPNIPENAFDSITKLNTYPKLNTLGTAIVELCRPIIKDIEQILEEIQPEINQQKGSEKMNEPKKDRLKEITDSLEQGIKDLFSSGKYAEYLRTMSNFHSYSYNNILLIHSQKPNATLVAGFNKWKDKFSRYVKKGEKGIQIIAPVIFKRKIEEVKTDPDTGAPILDKDGNAIIEEKEVQSARFKVVSVFDVSQTDGKPLPQLADELKGDVKHFDEFVEALKRSAPVPVEFKPMQESMDGYFSNSEQKIAIREGMSEVQTVCALVHEIAHSKLHNTAILNEAEENPKNNRTQEVEAESISYAVCQYYGIETAENSFGYIATWSKDKELSELKSSLETISKTSSELINDIDRNFREICKERGIDLTKEEQTVEAEPISDKSVEEMATVEVKGEEPAEPIKEETEQTVETEPIPDPPAEENISTPSEVEETSEDLPDPTLTVKEMNDSGYLKEDMLPISKERAAEFMEQDITVYALHSDNTEEMLFDVSEIEEQSGNMFGIAKEDWEQVKESVRSLDNEKKFLSEDKDGFLIYQLKEDAPNELRFASLREIGCNPDKENYTAVYMGLTEKITDPIETLDKLYSDFNADRPKDFKGHSMSVSDVVALKKDGEVTFHFVDSIGFKELPDFGKDMVINTPIKEESKLPNVAELEQRENNPKSIMSKLKSPAVRQEKPKAPSKSAEMEI